MYCKTFDRGMGRTLRLYSDSWREYQLRAGLPSVEAGAAHMRWHPLRQEWVAYAAARQNRTLLPNVAECPLCPMRAEGVLTDIPVDDYEVAIFTNRFAALSLQTDVPPTLGVPTVAGLGVCEVVCFSADHHASFSTIGRQRIALLIAALSARIGELYALDTVKWVLPFESRGREIGVTLDHPHGQIYALSHLPSVVERQARAFMQDNPLIDLADRLNPDLILAQNDGGMVFCPEWSRYPFEVWVVPHQRMADPREMDEQQRAHFAELLDTAAKMLDNVFDSAMPYTFSWQIAPKGFSDSHHFYCLFQPVKRAADKLKFLASVEQFTSFFLVDIPPEQCARQLREAWDG